MKSVAAALFCFTMLCCATTAPSTKLTVQINGAGHVRSDPPGIDCANDGSGTAPSGPCSMSVAQITLVQLRAEAPPGTILAGWGFATTSDCSNCNSGDPEMGAINEQGDVANITVDVNEGYDATETVTANFAAVGK